MKRSDMLTQIAGALFAIHDYAGFVEGAEFNDAEVILGVIEEAGMIPPSFLACMYNGKAYNKETDQGRDTFYIRGWEEE